MNKKKFDPRKLQKLNNPRRLLDIPPDYIWKKLNIEKPGGEIFVVDWKKKDMPEGPPAKIRFLPEQVKEHLLWAGFKQVGIYNELQKNFLVVGKKEPLYT